MTSLALIDERMRAAVGAPHVATDEKRLVVRPGSAAEIADVLRIAREVGAPVGLRAKSGVAIELHRMCNILHLDETSLLCVAQVGLPFEELEAQLSPRGLTAGPSPHWSKKRTLGALLAAPRPSEASPRGRFTAQCAGLSGLLADGTTFETRVAPRKATGPDLVHALVGARGTLGLITSATLRLARRGEAREEYAWRFPAVEDALLTARALLVRGARPLDLAVAGPTLALVLEGTATLIAAERELASELTQARRGEPVPNAPLPLITRPPHERTVALAQIESALPPVAGRVVGWNALGAAVVDPDRAPSPPDEPGAFFAALKRRLDGNSTFPNWPGA